MGTTSVFSPAAQFGQRRTQSAKTSPNRTKVNLSATTQQQQQQQQQTTITATTPTQPLTMLPLDARPSPPTRIMSAAVAQKPQPNNNKPTQNITVQTTNLFDDDEDTDYSPHPHNLDLNLAKYRLLESQHEALLSHLDSLQLARRPSSQGSTGSSPSSSFPSRRSSSASSYYRRRYHSSSTRSSTVGGAASPVHHIMSAGPLETVPDGDEVCLFGEDERRLFDVNEAIKRSLTELLNCEQARADVSFRTQIQSRLMEAERELRMGRRRRSCASSVGDH
ncbi:uncharacterized protein PgNI_00096 [Pyricularia grisea]|uniref:Uncharacterized protein n=1 Tax=Pyricularia grisea TaxID=148305 RepID=A0A6P8BIE7_PYRGI|nr:uncharacterized protein PgNI_00096 [Pyricularia grisea]TLD16485.1 hypothetical protein PgNI_00096 [Pyricularia grisea]